jgi:hypothetical protein
MTIIRRPYLACALTVFLFGAFVSSEPILLNPIGSFDIKKSLPESSQQGVVMVQEFLANDTGLYFLIAQNQDLSNRFISASSRISILHTDAAGKVQKLMTLPSSDADDPKKMIVHGFAVDDVGNCLVLESLVVEGNRKMEFVVYDSAGTLTKKIPAADQDSNVMPVLTFCARSRDLFYFTGNHFLQYVPGGALNPASGPGVKYDGLGILKYSLNMSALPGDSLALLDGALCRLYLMNTSSSVFQTISLDKIPEVKQGLDSYEPETKVADPTNTNVGRAIVLPRLVTSKQGGIYLAVTGHDIRSGAVIIRIDSSGKLLQSLRCNLSGLGETGYLQYAYFAINDTGLMLCSYDGVIAIYPR